MMNCAEYRRAVLSDPHDLGPEMLRHAETCAECTQYTSQLRRFEDRLGKALRVDVSEFGHGNSSVVSIRSGRESHAEGLLRGRPRWFAAAASVVLALVVAGGLWIALPGPSLAADVVSHMAGEPAAWDRTETPVAEPKLEAVLRESHIRFKRDAGLVTYANSCLFRGHSVPHLVVQTAAGPVTVMVLTHEPSAARKRFDEQGYHGEIVPVAGHGSLAVLERGPAFDEALIQGVAAQVVAAIDWTT